FSYLFSFYESLHLLNLHSFPTRRSSDLVAFDCPKSCQGAVRHRSHRGRTSVAKWPLPIRYGDVWRDSMRLIATAAVPVIFAECGDRKSTRLNSSHLGISYAVFCLKKKKK